MNLFRATLLGVLCASSIGFAEPAPDNTETNKRDRNKGETTADQQKNDKSDLQLTAQIRRSIMKDKSLSTNAHNVKIIAQNGMVTLKGPVKTDAEKSTVQTIATQVAGPDKVKCELEVKP